MATDNLEIVISARDQFSVTANRVIGKLGQMQGAAGRVGKGFGQLGTGLVKSFERVALIAGTALVGAVGMGVKSLAELSQAQQQTAAVIASTGGKAGVTAQQVRDLANSLEDLTTADDKAIQRGENMLLTFTNIGKDIFPEATRAMVNLGIAMNQGSAEGADFQATAIQIGKALQDPIRGVTALRRVGVALTEQQEDEIKALVKMGKLQEAQKIILRELAVEFGKAGEAAGKDFGSDLRRVQDAIEEATMALASGLMPIITEAAVFLKTKLTDPATLARIRAFGKDLASAGRAFLGWLEKLDWDAIGGGLAMARDAAKAVVDAFLSLPDWVKTAVLTGWGLNKLSGGLLGQGLGNIVGGLGQAITRGVASKLPGVGGLFAQPVFVTNWPVGFGAGGGIGARGGLGLAGTALSGAAVAGALAAVHELKIMPELQAAAGRNIANVQSVIDRGDLREVTDALIGLRTARDGLGGLQRVLYDLNAQGVKTHTESLEQALADAAGRIQSAVAQAHMGGAPGAFRVSVSVTARDVDTAVKTSTTYGTTSGSYWGGSTKPATSW